MSELSIKLSWKLSAAGLIPNLYSNEHTICFNENHSIKVDAAPDWGGNINNTNPEQSLAASLSSCHMMTFLALAAKAKWPVISYKDFAVAYLGKNAKGKMCVTQIDLNPKVTFNEGFTVDSNDLAKMQDRAHRYCFIANTLSNSVKINLL